MWNDVRLNTMPSHSLGDYSPLELACPSMHIISQQSNIPAWEFQSLLERKRMDELTQR